MDIKDEAGRRAVADWLRNLAAQIESEALREVQFGHERPVSPVFAGSGLPVGVQYGRECVIISFNTEETGRMESLRDVRRLEAEALTKG